MPTRIVGVPLILLLVVPLLLSVGGCGRSQDSSATAAGPQQDRPREDALPPSGSANTVAVSGDVRSWQGPQRPGQPDTLEFGAELPEGTTVATGSDGSCGVQLGNDSMIRLQSDTTVTLDRLPTREAGSSVITLVGGAIRNTVHGLEQGQRYQVRVRSAVLDARGTRFNVSVARSRETRAEWLEIRVTEGTVILTTDAVRTLGARLKELSHRPDGARLEAQVARTTATLEPGAAMSLRLARLADLEESLQAALDLAETTATVPGEGVLQQSRAISRELVALGSFLHSGDTPAGAPADSPQ